MKNTKRSLLAAASILSMAGVQAQATEVNNIRQGQVIEQCLPVSYYGSVTLCNAKSLNKKLNLKLGDNGCAIEQESKNLPGVIGNQVLSTQYVIAGENSVILPACESEYEIGSFAIEL